ncbi:hypothetical protein [Asaia sp. HN010]|uniref:hypothetical protein n=1 Tax=Asaia sp. HN010 TaxID=3081233 RepID=UPI0030183497
MTQPRSHHPALDEKLAAMPARLAAEWGLWVHSGCSCGASSTSPVKRIIETRPDIAHCRVKDIAERLRCKSCKKPLSDVSLSDVPERGPFVGGWRLPLMRPKRGEW